MKRVLMLLENNPYPQDGRVRREATALVAAGYQVSVIAPAKKGQPRRQMVNGVSVSRYRMPYQGDGLLGYVWEYGISLVRHVWLALRVLLSEGFDVIHAHNPPDVMVLVALPFKLLGKKFVFDHHDIMPEMYASRFHGEPNKTVQRALIFFERLSCRVADHIIATNESYKRLQMARSAVSADKISVVRNGPEPERIRPVAADPELRLKARYLLGYVGEMGVHDGVDYLLRSLAILKHQLGHTDFLAILIGTGDEWPALRRLAHELNIGEQVWFTGRVSDEELVRYLSTVDVCVDPDPHNPFNDRSTMIKMTEYMALGKPIVSFDLTEHRFTAQAAAAYVQPNNEQAFAETLIALFEDPARRAEMGRIGRQRALTELAWQHQVPHLLAAYARLFSADEVQAQPVMEQSQ